MSGESKQTGDPIGFDGLVSLATALPAEPVFPADAVKVTTDAPSGRDASRTIQNPSPWTANRKWALVGVGALGVVIAFGVADDASRRSQPPSSYAASSTAGSSSRPAYTTASPGTLQATDESKPAAMRGQVLSRSEIRYCLAERVRVEAVADFIDATSDNHIDRYNSIVADYNSRCSNYKYRDSDMNAAKAAVDASGPALKLQASLIVKQWR